MSRTKDKVYMRNRARLKRSTDICALCGGWIDHDLQWPDPMSFSADHIIPVNGDMSRNRGRLQAAHLVCNQRRKATPPPTPHARTW